MLALFLLLFYREEKFDLRGENKASLYLRLDVEENADSYTTDWDITPPSLKWNQSRTFYFDGHSVIADLKTLPLVYHFELTGKYTEKAKYNITLYFPFTDEYFPTQDSIEKLTIPLDARSGVSLDLYDLKCAFRLPICNKISKNCAGLFS